MWLLPQIPDKFVDLQILLRAGRVVAFYVIASCKLWLTNTASSLKIYDIAKLQ